MDWRHNVGQKVCLGGPAFSEKAVLERLASLLVCQPARQLWSGVMVNNGFMGLKMGQQIKTLREEILVLHALW